MADLESSSSSSSSSTDGGGAAPPKKTRVAIYGGAFDPPTVDHMRLVAQILRSKQVDEVWVVPCGKRPDKPSMRTSVFDRWLMCHIAVNGFFPPDLAVRVCDVDIHRDKALFTHDMLHLLSAEHGATKSFTFVVGTDWLQPSGQNIRNWESADGVTGHILMTEYDFLVLKRPGYDVTAPLSEVGGPRFRYLDVEHESFDMIEGNGSSTQVRRRLGVTKDLHSVAGLVPLGVLGHIQRANLYFDDGPP